MIARVDMRSLGTKFGTVHLNLHFRLCSQTITNIMTYLRFGVKP